MARALLQFALMALALACANPPLPPDPPVLLPRGADAPPLAVWPRVPAGLSFSTAPWPMNAQAAEQILTASDGYMLGEGMASDINQFPTTFVALNVVLDQADGVAILERIGKNGTPAGQLWALSGLKLRNASTANALQMKLRQSHESVWTGLGCILGKESVAGVADRLRNAKPQTWLRAGRNSAYLYLNGLANKRLNAAGASVTGVAVATPAPDSPAR